MPQPPKATLAFCQIPFDPLCCKTCFEHGPIGTCGTAELTSMANSTRDMLPVDPCLCALPEAMILQAQGGDAPSENVMKHVSADATQGDPIKGSSLQRSSLQRSSPESVVLIQHLWCDRWEVHYQVSLWSASR